MRRLGGRVRQQQHGVVDDQRRRRPLDMRQRPVIQLRERDAAPASMTVINPGARDAVLDLQHLLQQQRRARPGCGSRNGLPRHRATQKGSAVLWAGAALPVVNRGETI
jgi:hypothetical protein